MTLAATAWIIFVGAANFYWRKRQACWVMNLVFDTLGRNKSLASME